MGSMNYSSKYEVKPQEVIKVLSDYMLADGYDFVLDLSNSQGSHFVEERTNREYLDFFTCFASMPIGMNHPKLKEQAYLRYLSEIALNKPSNSDVYTTALAAFVKTFFKTAVPEYFKYSFYISGGALAVENALKTSFDWKVRKNFQKGYKYERGHKIIHFKEAFHGRSGYTMSLTNTDPIKTEYFPKFEWPRISNPKITFPKNVNIEEIIHKENISIQEIKDAIHLNKDDIAAIIIEPIQGEGGDNHFRTEFMQKLRDITLENDILLIFDEVQTGVGITGKWWAHQNHQVEPDIMAFGKKMQTCGILVSDRIDEVQDNVFKVSSRINSTWGGNLVDMVRATKYLEIIEEENLVENAKITGNYLLEKIENLAQNHNSYISNSRGKGLFCAFDMNDKEIRNKFISECFKEKLMILGCGEKSVRFRPPLNISKEEINQGFDVIERVIKYL